MLPIVAPILLSLASTVGAPLIERVLAGKIGGGNAELVGAVVRRIAEHAGSTPEELEAQASVDPEIVEAAIAATEKAAPELIALYAAGLEGQFALLQAEMREPVWTWAWRPIWMYGLLAMWVWNLIGLHVANAVWKIALPQVDLSMLLGLSTLFLGLYMGGHTVKDAVGKVASRFGKSA